MNIWQNTQLFSFETLFFDGFIFIASILIMLGTLFWLCIL